MEQQFSTSFRSLSLETQREIRRSAIKMWRHGSSHAEIQSALNISRNTLQRTITAWKKGGQKALASMGNKGGRPAGSGCLLTQNQENRVLNLMADHSPGDYGLKFILWNRDAVRLLVRQTFDIELARTTVGLYLRRWGLADQRPRRQSSRRGHSGEAGNIARDVLWCGYTEKELAAIRAEAREQTARIFFVGGGILKRGTSQERSDPVPDQKTTFSNANSSKPAGARMSLISAVSPKGDLFFKIVSRSVDSDSFVGFMDRLLKQARSPVLLVLDSQRSHRSSKTLKWVAQQNGRVILRRLDHTAAAFSLKAPEAPESEAAVSPAGCG